MASILLENGDDTLIEDGTLLLLEENTGGPVAAVFMTPGFVWGPLVVVLMFLIL